MATPEVQAHFEKMVADFVTQCHTLMDMMGSNFNNGLDSIQKNYVELQAQYAKAHVSMIQQAQKANSDMLENMEKSFTALKNNLKQLFESTTKQSNDFFATGMETFKTQCEDAIKKYPSLPSKLYQDTMKHLKELQSKGETSTNKVYKDIVAYMDKNYEEAAKQMKFPAIKEPTLPKFTAQKLSIAPVAKPAPTASAANNKPTTSANNKPAAPKK